MAASIASPAGTTHSPLSTKSNLSVHHSIMWRLGQFVVVAAIAACLVHLSSAAATPRLRRAVVGDANDERALGRRWFIDWGGSLGRLPSRDDMITPIDPVNLEAHRAATESAWEAYRRRLAREQAEYWNVIFGGHTPP
ncbi:hypothetical protein PANT_12c00026 [Moesziomyces antarcticus T-34]|uniref:Transmembrane protein n=1 Tax=Pseudozyma antarctica (strain T-34) TaxID=1151754 RepID=M9LWB6_PSEA3|nr:hypothetical protein PANT_12c00026 [Moesziomyces antarcticus T-34]